MGREYRTARFGRFRKSSGDRGFSEQEPEVVQHRRLLRALGFVVVLLTMPAIGVALGSEGGLFRGWSGKAEDGFVAEQESPAGEAFYSGGGQFPSPGVVAEEMSADAWSEFSFGSDDVPAWFSEEVLSYGEMGAGYAAADWRVVSFFSSADVDEMVAEVSAALSSRGWLGYGTGIDSTIVFMKEGGTCSWAMLSCSQMSNGAAAVLRLAHHGEG